MDFPSFFFFFFLVIEFLLFFYYFYVIFFLLFLIVKLNGSRKVTGVLRGFDPFLNIVLDDAMEEVSATERHNIGMIVRCFFYFTFLFSSSGSSHLSLCPPSTRPFVETAL